MAFLQEARQLISQERIYTDELRRLAWGDRCRFLPPHPQMVIHSEGEGDAPAAKLAGSHNLPVTSGQRDRLIRTSRRSTPVLVAGKHWESQHICSDHEEITLQPGIIGQR